MVNGDARTAKKQRVTGPPFTVGGPMLPITDGLPHLVSYGDPGR